MKLEGKFFSRHSLTRTYAKWRAKKHLCKRIITVQKGGPDMICDPGFECLSYVLLLMDSEDNKKGSLEPDIGLGQSIHNDDLFIRHFVGGHRNLFLSANRKRFTLSRRQEKRGSLD